MSTKNKYDQMKVGELEKLVRRHNHLYFVEHKPEISDAEFDILVETLKAKKPSSKVLSEIGSDLFSATEKVRHETPMLSLDKAYDEETMNNWAGKFNGDVIVSPKIDGCAVSIKYNDKGELFLAATRGSGVEGELITKNILEVRDIPKKIALKNVEVRGEVYMPLSVFKKYKGEFSNPRNLAAGAIKQKDPARTADYEISFWGYDLLGSKAKTEAEKRHLLSQNKVPVIEWKEIKSSEIQKYFEKYFAKRDEFDFETDGVVYKVNDVHEQEELGVTAHHPRFAIAYKFQGDYGETTLKDIEWSVSRTGVITPVGIVEPVELSGAMVSRASLHNYSMMKNLNLTRGARVLMVRRGGVIPYLEKVVAAGKGHFEAPSRCPSCNAVTEVRDDFLYCTNKKSCIRTKIAELEHFIKTIECDGFGEKLIAKLYETQMVVDPADFYSLTADDLMKLERMGDVLATKLIRNINDKRELPLDVFLCALGIREFGKHASKLLVEKYGTLEKILKVTKEDLAEIHSIGDIIAGVVVDGLKEKRHLIDKLLKEIKITKIEKRKATGPLADKKVLFTGALVAMERKAAQKLVEENGGTAVDTFTKDIDYLVVGDGGGAGSKLEKAKKVQSIKILGEKEFFKMLA